jgi:outer membrane biosynthesis protein TonB
MYPSELPDGTTTSADVKVLIGPDGSVESSTIYRSSGYYAAADAAAVKSALRQPMPLRKTVS